MIYTDFFFILIGYLFGSISSAIIVCKLMDLPDPRLQGSRNPGATNVLRIGGKTAAFLTLFGDVLKGLIPVLLAKWWMGTVHVLALIALAAFLGHLYPLFFRFEGGKGVATLIGCLFALSWQIGCIFLAIWLMVAVLFRYSSLAALTATLFAPLYTWHYTNLFCADIVAIMAVLLFYRHRENIRNLLNGDEKKIGYRD